MKLDKIKSVDLREAWKHEALDFTRWLAEPENIELLSDEVGIEIEVTQIEASVGRFNVDILGQEANTDRVVIIENQLEVTDHSHLGQIITYASGLEAEYIIWIVKDVKEEHSQAIDWLNEHTDDHINFFLLQIQLWQIGDSALAPKFSIISRPNDWKRSIKSTQASGNLSDTKTKQLEFWQGLREYANPKLPFKLRKAKPQHWHDVAIGRSDCHMCLVVDSRLDKVGLDLWIADSKELFHLLHENKVQIENELGYEQPLEWHENPTKKASRVRLYSNLSFNNEEQWEAAYDWLTKAITRFRSVFGNNWKI